MIAPLTGPPLLLRNDQQLGHRWLRLKLVGTHANRDAIGAWVHVRTGGRMLSRQVMPTKSYLSQSELPLTFGLGTDGTVDEVLITWPGGREQRLTNVETGKTITVHEPE